MLARALDQPAAAADPLSHVGGGQVESAYAGTSFSRSERTSNSVEYYRDVNIRQRVLICMTTKFDLESLFRPVEVARIS